MTRIALGNSFTAEVNMLINKLEVYFNDKLTGLGSVEGACGRDFPDHIILDVVTDALRLHAHIHDGIAEPYIAAMDGTINVTSQGDAVLMVEPEESILVRVQEVRIALVHGKVLINLGDLLNTTSPQLIADRYQIDGASLLSTSYVLPEDVPTTLHDHDVYNFIIDLQESARRARLPEFIRYAIPLAMMHNHIRNGIQSLSLVLEECDFRPTPRGLYVSIDGSFIMNVFLHDDLVELGRFGYTFMQKISPTLRLLPKRIADTGDTGVIVDWSDATTVSEADSTELQTLFLPEETIIINNMLYAKLRMFDYFKLDEDTVLPITLLGIREDFSTVAIRLIGTHLSPFTFKMT